MRFAIDPDVGGRRRREAGGRNKWKIGRNTKLAWAMYLSLFVHSDPCLPRIRALISHSLLGSCMEPIDYLPETHDLDTLANKTYSIFDVCKVTTLITFVCHNTSKPTSFAR